MGDWTWKEIKSGYFKTQVAQIKSQLRRSVEARELRNWATLLFFVKTVNTHDAYYDIRR